MPYPIMDEDANTVTLDHPMGPMTIAKDQIDPALLAQIQSNPSSQIAPSDAAPSLPVQDSSSVASPADAPPAADPGPTPTGASGTWDAPPAPGVTAAQEAAASPKVNPDQIVRPPSSNSVPPPPGLSSGLQDLSKAFDEEKAGKTAEAKALSARAGLEASAIKDSQNQMQLAEIQRQQNEADRQQSVADQVKKVQSVTDAYLKTGSVDPNRLWHNASTGSQVAASIGIILGGIGGGVIGQGGNVALDMINKAIDRDIEAQRLDLDKKKTGVEMQGNLLGQMRAQFGDERAAEAATRAAKLDALNMQLKQASASTESDVIKARALSASGEIDKQKMQVMLPFQQQMYMMKATEQLKTGNSQGVNLEYMSPEVRDRFVPGLGMANSKEDATKIKAFAPKVQAFHDTLDKLAEFSKLHSGTILDRSVVNSGKALAAQAQDQYRQLNAEGTFKAGESNFIESMIPTDPTEYFASQGYAPKLQQVKDVSNNAANRYYQSYGIRPQIPYTERK